MSARLRSRWRPAATRAAQLGSGLVLLSGAHLSFAAQSAALTQGEDVVTAAGIVRVVIAFVIVAVLGIAAVAMLRRVMPRFSGAPLAGSVLRVVERANLGPATRVHLVQVDGERILVAENRGGLTMVVLGRARPDLQP